jgi:anti-anti-sigma factor
MDISQRLRPGADVIAISGQATANGHLYLRAAFREALEDGRLRFILDLSHVRQLDSMMIGEMVACFKRVRERQGDIKLVVIPDGIVHALLQMTGLDTVFQIFSDENEAVAAFHTESN